MIHPYSDKNKILSKKEKPSWRLSGVLRPSASHFPALKHRAAAAEFPGHLWSQQDQTSAGFASSLLISSSRCGF
jgi:hypothetical protein